ncbi:MAG: PA14 domain-containing protein, partial [Chloroflexota bacterium]
WDQYQIGGGSTSTLVSDPSYPHNPVNSGLLSRFEAPAKQEGHFGQRISGYIYPPTTGKYQFWISSSSESELWLSSDDSRGNRELIAFAPSSCTWRDWDSYIEQGSISLLLRIGQAYYIEALSQNCAEKNHLSVAWQVPGSEREVIDGIYLSDAFNQNLREKEIAEADPMTPPIFLPCITKQS